MRFSVAPLAGAALLLSSASAFIIGPTVQNNVTVALCLETTGTIQIPQYGVNFNFTFHQVGKYACVLNDVKTVGDARAAPGDDPNLEFTVGKDVEDEVFWKHCLSATGDINIPGKGTAPVTFLHVDKYACMFSIVGPFSNKPVPVVSSSTHSTSVTTLKTVATTKPATTKPATSTTATSKSATATTSKPPGDCEVQYIHVRD